MATTLSRQPVSRLCWANHARDGVLGVSFSLFILIAFALLCFTPPVLAGMGVNTDILAFLWSDMTIDALRAQVFFIAPDLGLSFTPQEAAHLADVRILLHQAGMLCGGLALIVLAGTMLRPNWARLSGYTFATLAVLAASLGMLWATQSFKAVSALFHGLLFQNNWQFAPHQLMMQLYPPAVMQLGMMVCFAASLLVSGTLMVILWHRKAGQ
jgi:hypothetical protein